jgi:hypothetical protein
MAESLDFVENILDAVFGGDRRYLQRLFTCSDTLIVFISAKIHVGLPLSHEQNSRRLRLPRLSGKLEVMRDQISS